MVVAELFVSRPQKTNLRRRGSLEKKEQAQEFDKFDSEPKVSNSMSRKKPFVEPEISVPVDVLEATTFQQAIGSGVTN